MYYVLKKIKFKGLFCIFSTNPYYTLVLGTRPRNSNTLTQENNECIIFPASSLKGLRVGLSKGGWGDGWSDDM